MSLDLQEGQRAGIVKMLQLKAGSSSDDRRIEAVPQWKVLVYDRACQDIIAPLMKVGQLRNLGVTLHLALRAERHPVPDVPVIYFVEPTEESISRIVADYKAGLYSYMYVNFSSSISSKLLQKFASEISRISPPRPVQISKVIDRFSSFVSLDQTTFSLNQSSSYLSLHQSATSEAEIESAIDRTALGLLSLIVTCVRQVPVIRAPPNEAAGMVAQQLHERLVELVNSPSSSEIFSASASVSADPSHAQRPLLVILDRDLDLAPMVAHGWSYGSLMTDLLGMSLNKLSIPNENKHYDIDPSEAFWKRSAHLPFPEAATAVNELVSEFSRMRGQVTSADPTGGLTSAVSALPQITEMKKTVDMHTTIATALLNEIKARSVDKFVEIENDLNLTVFSQVLAATEGNFGDADKIRTALVLLLKKDNIPAQKIEQITSSLSSCPDSGALKYLRYLMSLRNVPQTAQPVVATPQLPAALGGLAKEIRARGQGLLANIKNVLPSNGNLVVTNAVQQLADQTQNALTDSFSYFDPRNPHSSVRVRGSFRQVIVCLVGGGCRTEAENLSAWATKTGRIAIYGATDFPSPTQFVQDLAKLGHQ